MKDQEIIFLNQAHFTFCKSSKSKFLNVRKRTTSKLAIEAVHIIKTHFKDMIAFRGTSKTFENYYLKIASENHEDEIS